MGISKMGKEEALGPMKQTSELNMGKAKDMSLEEQWGIPDVCLWNMPT